MVELLVVVIIIATLVAIAVPQYQKAVAKAKLSQFILQAKAIYQESKSYQLAHGGTPPSRMRHFGLWDTFSVSDNTETAYIGNQKYYRGGSLWGYFEADVYLKGKKKGKNIGFRGENQPDLRCDFHLSTDPDHKSAFCYVYAHAKSGNLVQKIVESIGWPRYYPTTPGSNATCEKNSTSTTKCYSIMFDWNKQ